MQEKRYVFGYGSILNPASMAKDIDPKCFRKWVTLKGYERIYDAPVEGSLSLNLRNSPDKSVDGMIFEADDATFAAFEKREKGYSPLDVTDGIADISDGMVYAFVMPNEPHPELAIPRSYFDLCANAVPESTRAAWIADTVVENPIVEK